MATRAGQAVQLVLDDVGHHDGQFGHLMPQGFGVGPRQGLPATATGRRHARDDFPNLFRGDEQALVSGVARLGTAFLPGLAGGRWRAAFAAKAVRRGRQGRVAGIGVQLGRRVRQSLLEMRDSFLLPGKQGLGVFEFYLQAAVSRLQLGKGLVRIGSFQFDDPATQGSQVGTHVLRNLRHRFSIHHADRQHGAHPTRLNYSWLRCGA